MAASQSLTPFAALCQEFLAEEYEAAPVMASGFDLAEFGSGGLPPALAERALTSER